mgnify:CR=1 FL=1
MGRLKTFRTYALLIIAFFIFSTIASNVLLKNSYVNLSTVTDVTKSEDGMTVETVDVKANKRQGVFEGKVTNTSGSAIEKKYIRVRAYDDDILLQTRYLTVNELEPGETRDFTTKFTADGINRYEVDFVDEAPIERTIIDDLIDKVLEFVNEKDKLGMISKYTGGFIDLNDYDIPGWAWLVSIGLVLYAIPSKAIWFII